MVTLRLAGAVTVVPGAAALLIVSCEVYGWSVALFVSRVVSAWGRYCDVRIHRRRGSKGQIEVTIGRLNSYIRRSRDFYEFVTHSRCMD